MKRESIKVEKRDLTGKAVRKLRKQKILPANVYGKDFKSTAVQLPMQEFKDLFDKVHETGLVDLTLGSESIPVLIHNVQYNPMTQEALHADFMKVNLKEKITASVPIISAGEPKAVVDKLGVLLQNLSELEIEALPTDLPENIEVNVETLALVDDQITVEQIKIGSGIEVKTDPTQVVFKIGALVTKEMEEQAAADEAATEAAVEEAKAEGEGEKVTPAEGEAAENETTPEGEKPADGVPEDAPAKTTEEKS